MKINNIILKPIVTEKSMQSKDSQNRYHFRVATKASKGAIKNEVERLFDVEVTGIKTMIMPGKKRRIGKTRKFTKTAKFKKAIIQLKDGQEIKLVTESK